jgi:spermidine synthase
VSRGRGRARGDRRAPTPPPVSLETPFALARVEVEPGHPTGRVLLLDGHEAGQVDLADPRRLAFAYMRRIADLIDGFRPPGAGVDAVHLGGGAFALPRYLAATRPKSRSDVYELDPGVIVLAREHLRLRTSPRLRVREGDAAVLLRARADRSADLVIGDAFAGQEVPAALSGDGFVAEVRRVLRPSGVYALNIVDLPPTARARAHAGALARVFGHVAAVAPPRVLRGRAPGNLVLFASGPPLPLAHLRRTAHAAAPREVVDADFAPHPAREREGAPA